MEMKSSVTRCPENTHLRFLCLKYFLYGVHDNVLMVGRLTSLRLFIYIRLLFDR